MNVSIHTNRICTIVLYMQSVINRNIELFLNKYIISLAIYGIMFLFISEVSSVHHHPSACSNTVWAMGRISGAWISRESGYLQADAISNLKGDWGQ